MFRIIGEVWEYIICLSIHGIIWSTMGNNRSCQWESEQSIVGVYLLDLQLCYILHLLFPPVEWLKNGLHPDRRPRVVPSGWLCSEAGGHIWVWVRQSLLLQQQWLTMKEQSCLSFNVNFCTSQVYRLLIWTEQINCSCFICMPHYPDIDCVVNHVYT